MILGDSTSNTEIRKRNRANKAKGYRWESEFCRYMNRAGFDFIRNGQRFGGNDKGDVGSSLPVTGQLKDVERISMWAVARDAQAQAENAGTLEWFTAFKNRGESTGDALVTIPLWWFRDLLRSHYPETEAND